MPIDFSSAAVPSAVLVKPKNRDPGAAVGIFGRRLVVIVSDEIFLIAN